MTARRALLSLVLVAPLMAGCYGTRHVPFDASTGLEDATGVTMRSGEEIVPGATIRNDTLRAVTKHDHVAIPVDSIVRISKRRFSPLRTGGLAIGITAVAALTFLAVLANALDNYN